jgi:hypothetical protein
MSSSQTVEHAISPVGVGWLTVLHRYERSVTNDYSEVLWQTQVQCVIPCIVAVSPDRRVQNSNAMEPMPRQNLLDRGGPSGLLLQAIDSKPKMLGQRSRDQRRRACPTLEHVIGRVADQPHRFGEVSQICRKPLVTPRVSQAAQVTRAEVRLSPKEPNGPTYLPVGYPPSRAIRHAARHDAPNQSSYRHQRMLHPKDHQTNAHLHGASRQPEPSLSRYSQSPLNAHDMSCRLGALICCVIAPYRPKQVRLRAQALEGYNIADYCLGR